MRHVLLGATLVLALMLNGATLAARPIPDLRWKPESFRYDPSASQRYIDHADAAAFQQKQSDQAARREHRIAGFAQRSGVWKCFIRWCFGDRRKRLGRFLTMLADKCCTICLPGVLQLIPT